MRTGPRTGFRWTPETIVYAVTLWYRKHSRPPFTHEWDQAGENHPSRQTVSRVFGSWNAAIHAAGFQPRPRGRAPPVHARGGQGGGDPPAAAARQPRVRQLNPPHPCRGLPAAAARPPAEID